MPRSGYSDGMQGALKIWRWWFVAIALGIAATVGVALFTWGEWRRDSIAHRARLLRPGMRKAEMIQIMGCQPEKPSSPVLMTGEANGTMLRWGDGERYRILTILDSNEKLVDDADILEMKPPPWRRALDWFKALLAGNRRALGFGSEPLLRRPVCTRVS
jgi:hypothetical protein